MLDKNITRSHHLQGSTSSCSCNIVFPSSLAQGAVVFLIPLRSVDGFNFRLWMRKPTESSNCLESRLTIAETKHGHFLSPEMKSKK